MKLMALLCVTNNREEETMYAPFNKETAPTTDQIAWILCQIIDDNAPVNWTRYRGVAVCIARNTELMENLQKLGSDV